MSGSGASTTSYTVGSLTNGTAYTFWIRAVNDDGDGAASAEVTATPTTKTIRLSASSTSIEEGNSGKKDVTINITLGEAAPLGGGIDFVFAFDSSSTGKMNNNYNSNSCTNPNPADADMCWGNNGTVVTIATSSTTGNWTFGIIGDTTEEEDETIVLTVDADGAAATAWDGDSITITIVDDDGSTPGVTVSPKTVTVTEATGAGQTGTYTVVLDTDPGGTVTVTPASSDEAAATVSAALVFDSTNWETAQTVTVTGVDDADRTNETMTVSHTVTDYGSGPTAVTSADDVTVTVTDDDVPAKPTGLSATGGNAQVTLNWSDPEDESITGYELLQRKGSDPWGEWSAIDDSDDETVSHTVTGLDNDSQYSFQIRAVNSNGDGTQSDVKEATPTAPATPGVTITPTSLTVEEGSSGEYTVVLDKAPSASVTVTVAGTSGEVTVTGSPVIFSPSNWNTAKTVMVNAGADADATNDSATLTHEASGSATGYDSALSIDEVSVTVTDTTPTLQLRTNPAAVREGENISLTVTSDMDLTGDVPVKLMLAARSSSSFDADDITGTLGSRDFTASFGSTGSKTGTVSIATSRDGATEGAESYRITLNDGSGYVVGTSKTADGTLNDGTISLSIGDVSAAEDGAFSFTVTASPTPSAPVTFKYKVTKESTDTATAGTDFTEVSTATAKTIAANAASTTITVTVTDDDLDEANETLVDATSTATADTDFTDLSGTLTFAPSQTSQSITVAVTGDAVDEPNETVVLKLSNPINASITTDKATGTINDDDGDPSLTITAPSAVTEGSSGSTDMVFTVTLAPTSGQQVSVDYAADATSTATADTDFTDLSGTLTFAPSQTSQSITVAVTGDAVDEPNETVVLKLSNPINASITTDKATGTINDDDGDPSLTITAPSAVTEGSSGSTDMVFTVTLAPTSGQQVSVDYAADATSTATADTDFTDLSGTLTFAPSQTSQSITVAVTGDVVDEPNETVVLKLSNPINASITTDKATGTINDDDGDPSLTITAPSAVTEGSSGSTDMVFTVTLAPTSGQQVSVDYAADATSTATADTDFTDLAGTLTFAPSQTSQSITVAVTGDVVDEPNETVVLKLSNPINASITTDKATGTINDDDGDPSLTITAPSAVTEGSSGSTDMVFTVTLAPTSGQQVSVDYGVDATSTATADTDFTDLAGTLTFAPSQTSQSITVAVTGDVVDEPNETVVLKLSNPTNASITTDKATGTINDDDNAPVLADIANQSIKLGEPVAITASANDADGDNISYRWRVGENTPALPQGTVLNAAQLSFTPCRWYLHHDGDRLRWQRQYR